MRQRAFIFLVFLLALGLVCGMVVWTPPAHADNLYASIRGTVVDPSGAVVPDAKLTATNIATGLSYSTTSSKDGLFAFLQLPIGDYSVKAEKQGFKTYTEGHIHLDLDQIYNLKVAMELGATSETITVEANPVQVQSTDMQLGTTVTGSEIVDLPLNGRNWTDLVQLQPGVVAASDRFGLAGNGGYSGNGAQSTQNSFLINGNDSNDVGLNVALVFPSPDSIGEFHMVSSTLNPEFGRNSGTIINAATKNGTNSFHGDAFEFYRDTFLDAPAWFENGKPTPFHQNEFGGTLGGPIIKNHAFFFFSYQGRRFREPNAQPYSSSVPVYSSAERGGDFSVDAGSFSKNPNPVPLYSDNNPGAPCPVSGGVQCAAGSQTYATLFPSGKIPTQDFNPLALKLMNQFVPLPNALGNLYDVVNPVSTGSVNQYLGRIDEKLGVKDQLWYYQFWESDPRIDAIPFIGANVPGFAEQQQEHTQQYAVSWSHTLSATALNELRVGYTRFNFQSVLPVNPINPTSYGFTGITPQTATNASIPVMNVAGLFDLGFSSDGPQPRYQDNYQIIDNFSKVWGHHSFKTGISFERLELHNPFFANLSGTYTYSGRGPFSTSLPGADFLLGVPTSYEQGSGSTIEARGYEYYAYVQDQWRVRPNLTITYGTGWDLDKPWTNTFDGGRAMGAFRPGQQSTVFPFMPPGFVYPGDTGINSYGGMTAHYDDFGPRLGFAWNPRGSTNWSVHGGIGLYFDRTEEELTLQTLGNAPIALTSLGAGANPVCGSPAFATPFVGVASTATAPCLVTNPFPYAPPKPGATSLPNGVPLSAFFPIGFGFSTEAPNFTAPRSTNFNLTIERQLSKSTILSVGYVGNIGRHEEAAYDTNLAGQSGVNSAAAAFNGGTCTSGTLLASPACPQTPITQLPNGTFVNGAPVLGATPLNVGVYGQPGVQVTGYDSNYNSLQVVLNRRFSEGLQVLAAYTWSRYFDESSNYENTASNGPGINPFNARDMYGPSANDAPQRFVVSYTYTLPIFKLTHRWKRLSDDWNLSGIYTLQHGFPIAVTDLFDAPSLTCGTEFALAYYQCPDRASRTSVPFGPQNPRGIGNLWFNPAAFTVPAVGTGYGDANRNPLYGPGINYGDLALEKNIHIDESRYFQVRLETFDTFNHANFANPNNATFLPSGVEDISSPGFGEIFSTRAISTNGDGRVLQLGAKFYF
jgi:Carboxypeptidase regulatory-like domain